MTIINQSKAPEIKRSEASQECWERGVTDGHVWYASDRQPPTPSNEDLETWAGVEGPYDDPAEWYGHMRQDVLDAYDKMLTTLFNAYEDGLIFGLKEAADKKLAALHDINALNI